MRRPKVGRSGNNSTIMARPIRQTDKLLWSYAPLDVRFGPFERRGSCTEGQSQCDPHARKLVSIKST